MEVRQYAEALARLRDGALSPELTLDLLNSVRQGL
jgi:hypothetical protein